MILSEDDDYYEEDLYGFEREDSSFGGGLQDGQVNSNGETRAFCVASSPIVKEMYQQGVSLGSMWYSGHFNFSEKEGLLCT